MRNAVILTNPNESGDVYLERIKEYIFILRHNQSFPLFMKPIIDSLISSLCSFPIKNTRTFHFFDGSLY